MAEDSGAFKTNPRNPTQIRHFVIPTLPGNVQIRVGFAYAFYPFGRRFLPLLLQPTAGAGLLYSRFSLIRGGERG
jgi:hypothetical protein